MCASVRDRGCVRVEEMGGCVRVEVIGVVCEWYHHVLRKRPPGRNPPAARRICIVQQQYLLVLAILGAGDSVCCRQCHAVTCASTGAPAISRHVLTCFDLTKGFFFFSSIITSAAAAAAAAAAVAIGPAFCLVIHF